MNTVGWRSSDAENPPNLAQIDTVYHCGGGMNGFALNAYGEMGICVISQQDTFGVRELGLRKVWDDALLGLRMTQAYPADEVRPNVASSPFAGCVRRMERWKVGIEKARWSSYAM